MYMCRSRYAADIYTSAVSIIASLMGTKRSPSLEYLSEMTSSILRKVKINDRTSFFLYVMGLIRIKEHVGDNDEHSWHPYDC